MCVTDQFVGNVRSPSRVMCRANEFSLGRSRIMQTRIINLSGKHEWKFIWELRVEIYLETTSKIYLETTSRNLFGKHE